MSIKHISTLWSIKLPCVSHKFWFNNFRFSSDTNLFPGENLTSFFTKCNSIKTPFNDYDHPVSINFKFHDINDFSIN